MINHTALSLFLLKPDKIQTLYNLTDTLWCFHIEFSLLACHCVMPLSEHRLQFHSCSPEQHCHFGLITKRHQSRFEFNQLSAICRCGQSNRVTSLLATRSLLPGYPEQQCCTCAAAQISSSKWQASIKTPLVKSDMTSALQSHYFLTKIASKQLCCFYTRCVTKKKGFCKRIEIAQTFSTTYYYHYLVYSL